MGAPWLSVTARIQHLTFHLAHRPVRLASVLLKAETGAHRGYATDPRLQKKNVFGARIQTGTAQFHIPCSQLHLHNTEPQPSKKRWQETRNVEQDTGKNSWRGQDGIRDRAVP